MNKSKFSKVKIKSDEKFAPKDLAGRECIICTHGPKAYVSHFPYMENQELEEMGYEHSIKAELGIDTFSFVTFEEEIDFDAEEEYCVE